MREFSVRRALRFSLALLLCVLSVEAGEYPPQELRHWIDKALEHNPALMAAHLEASSAHALGEHHGKWDAPDLAVEFYQAPIAAFPNPLKDQREIDYSVQQSVPWPGKLKIMSSAGHFQGEALERSAEGEATRLVREITEVYARLALAMARQRLNAEARQDAGTLAATSRTRYESGVGGQADWLRSEGEMASLESQAAGLEAELASLRSEMDRLAGIAEERWPDSLPPLEPVELTEPLDSLKERALLHRADLESRRILIRMGEAEVASARKALWPDLMLRGTYKDMLHSREDDWSLMIGLKATVVPWALSSWRYSVRQAESDRLRREREMAAAKLQIESEVKSAHARVQSAWRQWRLVESRRRPLAEQALYSALTDFAQGRGDFTGALSALREARMACDEALMARSEHLMAWAALTYALGGSPLGKNQNGGKP